MANLLVVDDDTVSLEYLQMIIGTLGHKLHLISDSNQAVKIIEQEKIDLVITDIIMEHSGLNFIQYLKRVNKKIPVIVITGSLIAASAVRVDESIVGVFIKPYNRESFINTIENALKK